jgi:hypothetical protein
MRPFRRKRRPLLSPFTWAAIPLVLAMVVFGRLYKNAAEGQSATPATAPGISGQALPADPGLGGPPDAGGMPLPPPPAGHVFTASTRPARVIPKEIVIPQKYVQGKGGRYLALSFDQLSAYRLRIRYVVDEAGNMKLASQTVGSQIPAVIAGLSGQKVALTGIMYPVEVDGEGGKVTRFMLLQAVPGCLYCQPPALNEWVDVSASPAVAATDKPVVVFGTLEVGEHQEEGVVASVYRMSCAALGTVPDR